MSTTLAVDSHELAVDSREAVAIVRRFNLQTLDSVSPNEPPALAVPLSVAVHLVVVAALFVIPALTASELPEPATATRAFFVEPIAQVPPPPPPPAAARSTVHPVAQATKQDAFVAPIEVPTNVTPEKSLDLGVEDGVPGGVAGGIEGGVVGGIVGGLPAAPAPPVAPVRVGGLVKEPRKVRGGLPEYPPLARRAHITGVVIIDAVIGADGRVAEAKVIHGIPVLDEAALGAVRQWVYTPTLLGGVPVPLEMTVTVTFNLKS